MITAIVGNVICYIVAILAFYGAIRGYGKHDGTMLSITLMLAFAGIFLWLDGVLSLIL